MSQTTATARSGARAYRATPQTARPTLRVISAEPWRPRQLPFVLLCSALLAAGLIGLLLLNTSLAQGAYQMHELKANSTRLAEDEMMLRERLVPVSSAQALAVSASKLGMVPLGQPPLTLELSSGTVRGLTRDQAPAGEDPFSVATTPLYAAPGSAEPSDKPATKSTSKSTSNPTSNPTNAFALQPAGKPTVTTASPATIPTDQR